MTRCPYCGGTSKEITREEHLNEYEPNIEILFKCERCKKTALAIMKIDDWLDDDDKSIEQE